MNRGYILWIGIAALAALVTALNFLVWTQQFFAAPVLAPLSVGAALGIVWAVLALASRAAPGAFADRQAAGIHAASATLAFLGICIMTYLSLGAWDVSWDLTAEGRRELAPQTRQVLQAMNTEVEVLCFFLRVEEELVAIARQKTMRFLEQCQKYTPLLKVEMLDPTVDRARLEALKITHASTQGTIVLRAGERQRVITLTGGSPRLEERDFTNALINVLRHAEPKVYFLTGHQERCILDEDEQQGGSILGNLLRGESYQVEPLSIRISDPIIPADADILVLNNPTTDLHPLELEALTTFISGGGRLLALMDPWHTSTSGYGVGERLRPWIEHRLGVRVGSDIVTTDQDPNMVQIELSVDNAPFEKVEEGFMRHRGAFSLEHPATRAFDQTLLLQAARSISAATPQPAGVVVTELLRSPPEYWAETDIEKLTRTGQAKANPDERKGPVPLAAAVTLPVNREQSPRGRSDARIVVVGDADFAANAHIIVPGHLNFLMNIFAWLTESEDLIAMRPTGKEAPPLLLTATQERAIAWFSIMFPVQVVGAVGLTAYGLRRNRR